MYKIIIFDLDDTLTNDFENTKIAFKRVLEYRNEDFTEEKFLKFRKIDIKTWKDMADGKIINPYENNVKMKTEWIRASRFIKYFGENNISYEEAVKINNIYIDGMKEKVVSRDGAYEIIKYLYDKNYKIIIATNGPLIPLRIKLEKLGINNYINSLFSAEEVGFMKPHKNYYEGLLKKFEISSKKDILFIGDDLEKDIKGGIDNGIDTCWCNYDNKINSNYKCKYEIHNLVELKKIL